MKKYSIIYADPPWFTPKSTATMCRIGGRKKVIAKDIGYNIMTNKQLMALPIQNICTENCLLFMWCIDHFIDFMPALMLAWGFQFKTIGFVWHKVSVKKHLEMGVFTPYTFKSCEMCYIGTRGKYFLNMSRKFLVRQFIEYPVGGHSKKPDIIRDKIVKMCGNISRIELFARTKTEGWDIWGDEIKSDIKMENYL